MQKGPPTPKGFRDITPILAQKRRKIADLIINILEEFGFEPIETPTIEFAQTLEGKYGEEEKLIYKFQDRGDRHLALRYDLTVPLARYVANNNPKLPFRRYQIGQVFRGENPQAGRYREFTQLDFDTVGSDDLADDAKIIACAIKAIKSLGFNSAQMLINDRQNFQDLPPDVIRILDKLHKVGIDGVKKELKEKNLTDQEINSHLDTINNAKPTDVINKIFKILTKDYNFGENKDFVFDPTLARGLDYYTGAIFELKPSDDSTSLSVGSGGRYDNLIGMFVYPDKEASGKNIPAVGFSFGIDRLIEATNSEP